MYYIKACCQLPLSAKLNGFDLVLVVGTEVWRYYPYVPGNTSPPGLEFLHITNDPHDAATALVSDSLLSDARLALEGLYQLLHSLEGHPMFEPKAVNQNFVATLPGDPTPSVEILPMMALHAWTAVVQLRPKNAIFVQESPSNSQDLVKTVLAIGDGSLHYSVQSIYTVVMHKVKLVYLVPVNDEYAILKEFAILEQTPNVPALDLPGLNAMAIAKAYGCPAFRAENALDLKKCFEEALLVDGLYLIEFLINLTYNL
ncbi:hypothetical protein G7Y89_g11731 [Cudoniella acicularis]|uniref:Thiamine pyrophosphate enzyme TPP-binding domain-containing protein n=1 Tax=Cudoniella acicularis TaxID=354080 RepID=A0A8H4VXL3_9HELO|nr:hypothetical protein G7Y89_g11731 [Cudoniella acicularis]